MDTSQKDSTTLYICPRARECDIAECPHRKPHARLLGAYTGCDGACRGQRCSCEPVASTTYFELGAEPDPKWSALRGELQDLQEKGVRTIDPVLVLRFMDYIEQAAEVPK